MDVTRDNFEASLDALADAIADPHFAFWSFDLEFTGLNASSATTFDLLDTPSDRFSKVHESCRHMTVLQYGVCCFAFNPSTRRWTARPFNFWLFPDAGRGTDAVFSCQASSMAFLADCGFDFNKAIRRGVPFVPAAERERNAERRARAANRPPIVPTNERDKEMVRRLREDVAAWLARGEPQPRSDADSSDERENPEDPSGEREHPGEDIVRPVTPDDLVLEPTNSFLRALTYQTLERETFGAANPPGYLASTRHDFPDGAARVVLRRASGAEIRADAEARAARAASEERIRDGFAAALRLLGASGKPAVAHNALYDVTFTLEKFLSNLDGSYEGFKSALNDAILGAFYDTKHLARAFADRWFVDAPRADAEETSAAPSLDTALGPLYENLSTRRVPKSREGTHANEVANEVANVVANEVANEVANDAPTILDVIDFPDGFDRYAAALRRRDADADAFASLAKERASFAHEAGYDAYMTGVCFLTMALYGRVAANSDGVGSTRVPPADSRDGGASPSPSGRFSIGPLGDAPFADADGIIPLQHSDMSHVHLRGDDPIPDRSRVVYLVGLAPRTNAGELARRFRDAGLGNPSHVSWMRQNVARVIGAPIDDRARNDAANVFDARFVERALRAGGLIAEVISHDAWTRRHLAPRETSLGTFLARVGLGVKRARDGSNGDGSNGDGSNGRKRARGDAEVAGSNSCAVM